VGRPRAPVLAALAAVLAAVALVYQPTLRYGFAFDDEGYLVKNANVHFGLSAAAVRWAFTAFAEGNWHPLTWISHMADVQLFGMNAGRHHAANILLHLANTALLFAVLWRLTGAAWRSLLVCGLFALHPLRVESVAWVSERKDLLCTCFWFLGLLAWVRFVRRPAPRRLAAVAALLALALMSKPMAVTFPLLLLVLDGWPLGRLRRAADLRPLVLEKLPLFALSAGSAVVTVMAQRAVHAVGTLEDYPAAARAATAVTAYATYLRQLVWPGNLAVFYPYPNAGAGESGGALALFALVLVAASAVAWWQRRRGYPLAGWCWYLGTLVPVIGIVQVGAQAFADRYTYVPLIGVAIALVWGAADLAARLRLPRAGAAALGLVALVALGVASSRQVPVWRSDLTLFGHAAETVPGNWLAYGNLGLAFADQRRYQDAYLWYQKALRIYPEHYETLTNLGRLLDAVGRSRDAAVIFEKAISVHPERFKAYVGLGYVYVGMRNKPAALDVYRRLLAVDADQAAKFLAFVNTLP
jgi:hypothetical protein